MTRITDSVSVILLDKYDGVDRHYTMINDLTAIGISAM